MGVRVVAHRAMSHWISGDVPLDFRVMAHWILGVLAEESKMRRARPSRASRDRHLPKTIKMHYTVHPFWACDSRRGRPARLAHPRQIGRTLGGAVAPWVAHLLSPIVKKARQNKRFLHRRPALLTAGESRWGDVWLRHLAAGGCRLGDVWLRHLAAGGCRLGDVWLKHLAAGGCRFGAAGMAVRRQ